MASYGAKLRLVDSMLISFAVYAMCSIRIPPKILAHLDKLRHLGLWRRKTDQGETSNSLAAWMMVCKPKQKGGLGVLDTKILNTALLLKFLDKFYNHHDVPWVEFIWSTYSTSSVPHAAGLCRSFWWRELIPLCRFNAGSPLFLLSSGRISGAGRYSRMPTRELFSYAVYEDATVEQFLTMHLLGEGLHLPMSVQVRQEVAQLQIETAETSINAMATDDWGPRYMSA
jgi:hypothetical protein